MHLCSTDIVSVHFYSDGAEVKRRVMPHASGASELCWVVQVWSDLDQLALSDPHQIQVEVGDRHTLSRLSWRMPLDHAQPEPPLSPPSELMFERERISSLYRHLKDLRCRLSSLQIDAQESLEGLQRALAYSDEVDLSLADIDHRLQETVQRANDLGVVLNPSSRSSQDLESTGHPSSEGEEGAPPLLLLHFSDYQERNAPVYVTTFVPNVSWSPHYTLEVDEESAQLRLDASLQLDFGVEWRGVSVSISNAPRLKNKHVDQTSIDHSALYLGLGGRWSDVWTLPTVSSKEITTRSPSTEERASLTRAPAMAPLCLSTPRFDQDHQRDTLDAESEPWVRFDLEGVFDLIGTPERAPAPRVPLLSLEGSAHVELVLPSGALHVMRTLHFECTPPFILPSGELDVLFYGTRSHQGRLSQLTRDQQIKTSAGIELGLAITRSRWSESISPLQGRRHTLEEIDTPEGSLTDLWERVEVEVFSAEVLKTASVLIIEDRPPPIYSSSLSGEAFSPLEAEIIGATQVELSSSSERTPLERHWTVPLSFDHTATLTFGYRLTHPAGSSIVERLPIAPPEHPTPHATKARSSISLSEDPKHSAPRSSPEPEEDTHA